MKKRPGEPTKWDNTCKDALQQLVNQKLVDSLHTDTALIKFYYLLAPVFTQACPKIKNCIKNYRTFCTSHLFSLAIQGDQHRGEKSIQWNVVI